MSRRYYRLAAAPLLYFSLGCFWLRYDFVASGAWWLGVIMLGLGTAVGGLLQERFDAAHVGYAGAALFGLGFVGTGLASTPAWHYFTLEVLIGFGSGIAYSTGIPLVARWFPDKLGLAIGAAVAGYVPASFVGGRVVHELIEMTGWRSAAQLTGGALFIIAMIAITVLRTAPIGVPPASAAVPDYGPVQMVRSAAFPSLWLSYLLAAAGAITIYLALPGYAFDVIAQEDRARASAVVGLVGPVSQVANAGARLVAGWLCDVVGGFRTLLVVIVLIPVAGFLAPAVWPPEALLAVAFTVLAGYGAMLAVYPILTATVFGLRHLGANCGIVFSGWAGGYVVGALLGPKLVQTFGTHAAAFYGAALISLVAFWLAVKSARLARRTR